MCKCGKSHNKIPVDAIKQQIRIIQSLINSSTDGIAISGMKDRIKQLKSMLAKS